MKKQLTKDQVKEQIKKMKKYDINKLQALSNRSGIELITLNFWYNCFHS